MKVIYGLKQVRKFKKPVVALGVFDGVHRGHRQILRDAVKKARSISGTSMVLTFWPHPQKEESLYSLEHRLRLIAESGIDVTIVISFNQKFAEVSPGDFIKHILVEKIKAHYIFVGRNFRFGKNAKGDCKTLRKFSQIYNFRLRLFKVLKIKNKPISSTYIRTLIKRGDINKAKALLTRPVSILGAVIKGKYLARKLGFSTANINPHHEVIPLQGVYAVRVIYDDKRFFGVCNIGTKPTFNPQGNQHIEVHIFNFRQNIYGKYLEIKFVKRIREERKFASIAALAKQVKKDIILVKRLFSCH